MARAPDIEVILPMAVKFIDYQTCEIDGKQLDFFKDPIRLFKQIEKRLSEIGAKKFYSSTNPDVKKDRESLAEFFFLLALKKYTDRDWFLMHTTEEFPDFFVMSISDTSPSVHIEGVELTEIPPFVKTFEEAINIVNKKLKGKYPLNNYNLLIFINNVQSRAWIDLLKTHIKNSHPFKSVWTILLLANKDNTELKSVIAHRLRPHPIQQVPVSFDDPHLYASKPTPEFIEVIKTDGHTFLNFKPEFIKEFRQAMKKFRSQN